MEVAKLSTEEIKETLGRQQKSVAELMKWLSNVRGVADMGAATMLYLRQTEQRHPDCKGWLKIVASGVTEAVLLVSHLHINPGDEFDFSVLQDKKLVCALIEVCRVGKDKVGLLAFDDFMRCIRAGLAFDALERLLRKMGGRRPNL